MIKNFQGIIFDMDGLLFDTEQLYYQATQEMADHFHIPYDFDFYNQYIGIGDEELWAAYHKRFDSQFGAMVVQQFIEASVAQTMTLFESGAATIKPGLTELLSYLNNQTIKKGIASSNQRKIIDILLEKNGLSQEFSTIVSCEDVVFAKPDPAIFLKAQESLGLPKENVLILEDSPNGIKAANEAGIAVVMIPDLIVPTKEIQKKTIGVLSSLAELPNFLAND